MTKAPAFNPRLADLASRIFVGLVRDAAAQPEGATRVPAEAERLAKLSFALSAGFHRVQDELDAENQPKNVGFTVQLDDIAAWSKTPAKP